MDLPEVVREALDDESVAARVTLGGKDLLLVTPSRTLVYRGEGLLSDESVAEYPHGAERIEIERGRRKSTVVLDYGLDGERRMNLPTDRIEDALHPVLAGVLNGMGVTESGEAIKETFLFNELTVVVTSQRLVWHVGESVWNGDFEQFRYDDVVDLRFEEGDVATSVVLRLEAGQERFKVPNDRARALRETLVDAVLAHHGFETLGAFREARTPDDADERRGTVDFGDGPDPLTADPPSGGRTTHADEVPEVPESVRERTAGAATGSTVDRVGTTAEAGTEGSAADADAESGSSTDDSDGDSDPEARSAADADGGTGATTDAESPEDAESEVAVDADADSFAGSGFEVAGPVDDRALVEEVAALREAVEEQNDLLRAQGERVERQGERVERQGERIERLSERIERQSDLFEQLVDELRRGR